MPRLLPFLREECDGRPALANPRRGPMGCRCGQLDTPSVRLLCFSGSDAVWLRGKRCTLLNGQSRIGHFFENSHRCVVGVDECSVYKPS